MWNPRRDPDPFLRLDSARYDDMVADGFVGLLRDRGLDALTLRALAAWMRVTPSAVTHRARWPETKRLFVRALVRRWVQWSLWGLGQVPALPSLPFTPEERHGVRVWYLARELARSEAAIGAPAALSGWDAGRAIERKELQAWWLASGHEAGDFAAFQLVLEGLRLALVVDSEASAEEARAMLQRMLASPPGRDASSGPQSALS